MRTAHCEVRPIALAALVLASIGCGSAQPTPPKRTGVSAIDYRAHVAGMRPCVVEVLQTLHGGADSLVADVAAGVISVEVSAEQGSHPRAALPGPSGRWHLGCRATCTVRYRYDLDAAAAASGDALDVAVRSAGDVLAPASTWLLRPQPLAGDVPVGIRVTTGDGVRFATGISAGADGVHRLRSQELASAGFSGFGALTTSRVPVTAGVVDLAVLSGERQVSDAELTRWVHRMALSLDALWGRFPVQRAQLFVVPEAGAREVEMARTLPAGGASVAVFVGARAREARLYADWMLVHELFHLGVPSFWREGRWLDEGLATYYEPVLRARANLLSETELWGELARKLPRGLGSPGDPPLSVATDHDRVYWGGALFALRADVGIRQQTHGARSLDDGLRAVLARGGNATRIWSVDDFLQVVDEAAGVTTTRELLVRAEAPGVASTCGSPSPASPLLPATPFVPGYAGCTPSDHEVMEGLMKALGVDWSEQQITLRQGAPLAAVRREIVRPEARRRLESAAAPAGPSRASRGVAGTAR